MQEVTKPIVFFDGYCGLCNRFIDLLIKIDKKERLLYAPLQGVTAKNLFPEGDLEKYDSIAFAIDGELLFKSRAVLRILRIVGRGWQLFNVFYIIPRFLSDGIYDWVARNRYGWFGKRDSCRMPLPEEKQKLLE